MTAILAIILIIFGSLFAYNKCSNSSDNLPEQQSEQPEPLPMDKKAIEKVMLEAAEKRIAQNALETRSNEKEDESNAQKVETESGRDSFPDNSSDEPELQVIRDLTSLEGIPLPVALEVITPFSLLDAAGKESTIPADTSVLVEKRSPSGTLTMKIGGKVYVGNESRLAKKVRLAPN